MAATVLVTGANGFVGRALCSDLARRGVTVRAAVRDAARGPGLPGELVVIRAPLTAADWAPAVLGVDVVIHLAARVHVMQETATDPLAEFRSVNVEGTATLARAAALQGVRRFVYVSSIKVNGEATNEKSFSPSDTPAPQDAYGVSKWEAERALARIAEETGLEVAIVRPPLVYGPGVGGNFLRLLNLVRRRIPLPFGAVDNRRSMIYNENLTDALIACAFEQNAAGKTYLVSDGEDLSTGELICRLAVALGTTARCLPVPPMLLHLAGRLTGRSAEIHRLTSSLTVDSTRIRSELDWSPPFDVGQGLAETAKWYQTGKKLVPAPGI